MQPPRSTCPGFAVVTHPIPARFTEFDKSEKFSLRNGTSIAVCSAIHLNHTTLWVLDLLKVYFTEVCTAALTAVPLSAK